VPTASEEHEQTAIVVVVVVVVVCAMERRRGQHGSWWQRYMGALRTVLNVVSVLSDNRCPPLSTPGHATAPSS
jgi:hypothetical protein